jgi:hypothetical protein
MGVDPLPNPPVHRSRYHVPHPHPTAARAAMRGIEIRESKLKHLSLKLLRWLVEDRGLACGHCT